MATLWWTESLYKRGHERWDVSRQGDGPWRIDRRRRRPLQRIAIADKSLCRHNLPAYLDKSALVAIYQNQHPDSRNHDLYYYHHSAPTTTTVTTTTTATTTSTRSAVVFLPKSLQALGCTQKRISGWLLQHFCRRANWQNYCMTQLQQHRVKPL